MQIEVSKTNDRVADSGLCRTMNDNSLVSAAQNGDHAAFELLVRRHERMILFKVMQVLGNRDDAEDVVQQTFHNAFAHLKAFEGRSSFSTWLTRIAINQALMLRRSSWHSHVVSIDELNANEETAMPLQIPDSRPNPERSYSQQERRRILYLAMNDLTPGIRAALEIREIGEQSVRETAQILGVSIPAVKSRVNRGRRILREKLERRMAFKNAFPARRVLPAA
jgi:RNA polymerase sigma-70 factor (ECF subfamily)